MFSDAVATSPSFLLLSMPAVRTGGPILIGGPMMPLEAETAREGGCDIDSNPPPASVAVDRTRVAPLHREEDDELGADDEAVRTWLRVGREEELIEEATVVVEVWKKAGREDDIIELDEGSLVVCERARFG